jgi:hypothetical protein
MVVTYVSEPRRRIARERQIEIRRLGFVEPVQGVEPSLGSSLNFTPLSASERRTSP